MVGVVDRLYTPVYDENQLRYAKTGFSRLRDEHYLDHAGATLYSDEQIKKISSDLLMSLYGNPHSVGAAGNSSHEIIEHTRHRLLQHFHTSSDEYSLVFTSGATAALKRVAETFQFQRDKSPKDEFGNFVYTQDNHTSVLGMRDVVVKNGAKVLCLNHDEAHNIFSGTARAQNEDVEKNKNSLFVYSAQCNFSGVKYNLSWIEKVQNGILEGFTGDKGGRWHVLLDAAGFAATNDLDLSAIKPDFVCISFYKMFGYPTGVGALLVKKSSASALEKVYYGGGTVKLALSSDNFHIKRDLLHERFEDGTLPFLSIIALQHGLDAMSMIPLKTISRHVFSLGRYLHHSLIALRHHNGNPAARLYADTNYEDEKTQGGIVTFNLLRSNGEYIGYTEVIQMGALFKIHLRTGCFCNPGACQRLLGLSDQDILNNFDAGYTCGGSRDLINGNPTGAVRVSFGYMSTSEAVEALLHMIRECFLERSEKCTFPKYSTEYRASAAQSQVCNGAQLAPNNIKSGDPNDISLNDYSTTTSAPAGLATQSQNRKKIHNGGELSLGRLFVYPIKSCAPYEVTDSWILGKRGLQYDREWMVVSSKGMPPTQVPLESTSEDTTSGQFRHSRICGHRIKAIDCGSDVSEWLSLALKRPNLRLVRQHVDIVDFIEPALSFSSQAQYSLINEASIQWLMNKLSTNSDCSRDTILYRFRGNIILRGSTPFQEMAWSEVRIGKHTFEVDGPCTRCQMVCIDQTTGIRTIEPLRTLAEEFHGQLKFGIYLSRKNVKPVPIKIGDPITCS